MFVRRLSLPEIRHELVIDGNALEGRIDTLLRMGYIRRTSISSAGCNGGCTGCAGRRDQGCDEGEESTSTPGKVTEGSIIHGLVLTDKGKRLLGLQDNDDDGP